MKRPSGRLIGTTFTHVVTGITCEEVLTSKTVGDIQLPFVYFPEQNTHDTLSCVFCSTVVMIYYAQQHQWVNDDRFCLSTPATLAFGTWAIAMVSAVLVSGLVLYLEHYPSYDHVSSRNPYMTRA